MEKSTEVGLKETKESKAYTRVISKKLYELVLFLQSYDVKKVEPDRCDVGVDNKSID